MKVYKLIIMFNAETEEIEFIEESIEGDTSDDIIIDVDVNFDDDFLDIINKAGDCGIA